MIHRRLGLPDTRLAGSPRHAAPLRQCDKHGDIATPEGGVQLNPTRWVCAACWVRMKNRMTQ